MEFENTLRYSSFVDKPQVKSKTEYYDSLILTSNLLVGGKKAVTSLLDNLLKEGKTEYYIDPALTEFRIGENFLDENGNLRTWHQKLVQNLGDDIRGYMRDNDNLVPSDLNSEKRDNFAEMVAKFQYEFVEDFVRDQVERYEVEEEEYDYNLRPKAIIPLYEKIETQEILEINIEMANTALQQVECSIKPCIFTTKDFISDEENIEELVEKYSALDIEEVFIWVEGLDKYETTVPEYQDVIRLVESLSENSVNPHFMYGDYFANLLQKFGLSGTSYGVYHSESKSEKKNNSGGGALQRYYIDPLKAFTSIPRAVKVLETVGYDICSCSFCNENLEKPTDLLEAGDDHNFLKNHFVCLKYIHKEKVSNENLDTLLSELQENLDKFKEQFNHTKLSKTKNIGHLKKWKVSIEKYNS